jgi:hypothetical protein
MAEWTRRSTIIILGTRRSYSWDSAVCIATCYGLDGRGVVVGVPVGARFFSFPRRPRPGREVDLSLVTSAEVKKKWIYTSTRPYVLMVGWFGVFLLLTLGA